MKRIVTIDDINWRRSPRVRHLMNKEVVADYAERYKKRDKLPLPVVATLVDGDEKYLICLDGMHRMNGVKFNGQKAMECDDAGEMSYEEACKYSLGCNRDHGLRRSNDDKRMCCITALSQWPDKSNLAIAQLVGVDDKTVAAVRKELEKAGKLDAEAERTDTKGRKVTPRGKSKESGEPTDETGYIIPPPIRGAWEEAKAIGVIMHTLNAADVAIAEANTNNELAFVEVNVDAALGDLGKVMKALECVIPYAVCPVCQGQVEVSGKACGMCKGRGFISEFRYENAVPPEVKRARTMAIKKSQEAE